MSAETANINVPTFDGYECIGMCVPKDEDDCYVLNHDGSGLIEKRALTTEAKIWIQVCYRKIKPRRRVFECVSEMPRKLEMNEYGETPSGALIPGISLPGEAEYPVFYEVQEQS